VTIIKPAIFRKGTPFTTASKYQTSLQWSKIIVTGGKVKKNIAI